jgi:murein DD-endopeptidase MepM/ murein hydrolase activator NlpD
MRKDDWIMLAALAALLAFLRRKVDWGTGWVWPVPELKTSDGVIYRPVISSGVGEPRGAQLHKGVDIFYERRTRTDRPEFNAGNAQGSAEFFAPLGTPILAAKDGVIWSSGLTPRGWTVVIDHGKPFATYYTHMKLSAFPNITASVINGTKDRQAKVKAGDIIGYMGGDPMDPRKLTHLHFSVAYGGVPEADNAAIDPEEAMKTWPRVTWRYTP